ncbi:hypothetical protein [Aminivibrio sp.]|uniref:hypothetical protein n=1 Tax=Aminivibrio sp. TaxID=1872489 RepID=UPI001A4DA35E|nr:hypothetical protein [Aminivibrio sp.]MBL3540665.1 hypothetical protein [Aminivibrio sp.]
MGAGRAVEEPRGDGPWPESRMPGVLFRLRQDVRPSAPGSDILNTWVYEPSASDIFFDDMESGAWK